MILMIILNDARLERKLSIKALVQTEFQTTFEQKIKQHDEWDHTSDLRSVQLNHDTHNLQQV